MNAGTDPALRLTRRDTLSLAGIVLAGVASLLLGLHLFPSVFPEATIRFEVDRPASRLIAESWLRDHHLDPSGYRHASAFLYADTAKVFLERELGLEAMNEAVEQTARIWAWSHRWYRPLQVEELRVDIAPTGQLVRFVHLLPDTAAGADLEEGPARRRAERFLAEIRPEGLAGLRYLGTTARRLDHRTDHQFTWEREDVDWEGGRYRHRVTIRGDRLGGYEEFVQIPEAWSRDYSRLRSKNGVAGAIASVFFILTTLAMLVVLLLEARKRRIRWRFAELLGLIGAVLVFIAGMNGLPQALYGYDTRQPFGGFIAERLVLALLTALGAGLLILLIVAAGENQYRTGYPRKLSLPAAFTWRGLRTKEFLFSAVGGLALACLFLAYQSLFYRVANSLGAWSPAEVPYDELLNSAFPLAFLLFIGFFPAVSEEFMSRAFSVPFFSKILRSRVLAILLASAIWAFGHSTYPNQPFYIRGLELLIAGSLICVLMVRFNLVMLLVWHYTVDALYSGYLLFRSGNPYYVASAAIAAGIVLLPVLVALIAYLRTGRFTDPEELRHTAEPFPERPEELPVPPPPVAPVEPLGRRRLLFAAGTGLLALLLALGISSGLNDRLPDAAVRIDRAEARARAGAFLEERGIDPTRFTTAVRFGDEQEPDVLRYIQSQLGLEQLASFLPDRLAVQSWAVRFFEPLQVEEVRVRLGATSGRIVAFDHRIAEGDSLPAATPAAAESLAVALLASVGLDVADMERKEAAEEPRPHRLDRSFAWEAPEGDRRNVAEGRYRLEVSVTGDRAAAFEEMLRLPEEYTRGRGRRTVLWWFALSVLLIGCGWMGGITVREAIRRRDAGPMRWRQCLPVGLGAVLVSLIASVNAFPRVVYRYDTSVPWANTMILVVVGLVTAAVFYFFFAWAGTALIQRLHPSVLAIGDARARRRMLPGALLALLLAPLWVGLLAQIRLLVAAWLPRFSPPPPLGASALLETSVPALGIVTAVLPRTFLLCLVMALLARWIGARSWPGRAVRVLVLVLIGLALALLPVRGVGEFAVGLLRVALPVAAALGLARLLLHGNPLATLTAAYGIFAVDGAGGLISQPEAWVRGHGIAAALLLLLPILWLLGSARGAIGERMKRPPANRVGLGER